jgi:predicted O-methyltransferase YrrM
MNFKHIYQDIDGWFSFPNLYSDMVKKFPSGSCFVEIGTYKGKSFSYLVVEAINSGKQFDIVGIDACPWPDVEPDFYRNMKSLDGYYRTLFGGDSFTKAKEFQDNSIEFCFIDANHTYEFVRKDIEAFLPKMKKGGVIAGHDYNEHHPGVIQAVNEIFKDVKYNPIEDTWIVNL